MRIYCIGIGGIGMSSVARMARAMGHEVYGADSVQSSVVEELQAEGIQVVVGHHKESLTPIPDLILISQAVPYSAPEDYTEAKRLEIPMQTWQAFLGELTKDKYVIAVCGTHGKSTTTGMLTRLFLEADLDPTVMVGTKMKELGGTNFRLGKSPYVLIEADEYHENFLNYSPTDILVTSLEPDHLDYYKTKERYELAFEQFFQKALSKNGTVFVPTCELSACAVTERVHGLHVELSHKPYEHSLGVFGQHNKWNAVLVEAVGKKLQIADNIIQKALAGFVGTWRRMELRGETTCGALVYDDYGHHPTEVSATLGAFREAYPDKKLICLFQPHQYSRSRQLLEEFGTSFGSADWVVIPEIYASRDSEEDKKLMNTDLFVTEVAKHHAHVENGFGLENTLKHVKNNPLFDNEQSVIVCMGAGTITSLAGDLVKHD